MIDVGSSRLVSKLQVLMAASTKTIVALDCRKKTCVNIKPNHEHNRDSDVAQLPDNLLCQLQM